MAHARKKLITVFMTSECNLRCIYCYYNGNPYENKIANKTSRTIDIEFAKRGILDFFEQFNLYYVRFYASGEPTLEYEKIKELYNFCYDVAGDKLVTEIQTNGCFGDEVCDWISEHINKVWISCDGIPKIQNALRPYSNGSDTSFTIEKNIKKLLTSKKTEVGTRATITPLNVHLQSEMIKYFHGLGVKAVFSDPVFPPISKDTKKKALFNLDNDFMMSYAKEFLRVKAEAAKLGVFYGSILTVNFDEKTEYFCRACIPCPHLTPDGYVTCCDMASSKDSLPELVYGKYNKETKKIDYNNDVIAKIQSRKASNLIDCKNCNVQYNCAGGCIGEAMNEQEGLEKNLLYVKKDYCEAIRYLGSKLPRNGKLYPYFHP